MREFNYVIIGGGCAGLSLAYELEVNNKLKDKTLAIIEPRKEYKRDKTWSFWKVTSHNFDDCVKKSWKNFSVNIPKKTNHLECVSYPYQSVDSGLFYEKINNKLKENKNIYYFKDISEINPKNSFIFNSVLSIKKNHHNLWQHFCGVEIETQNNFFDDEIFNLMDFDCEQRESVHFFYTLPLSKNKALVLIVFGTFLDGIAMMYVTLPLFLPLIKVLGIDPIQFAMVIIICWGIGQQTPPVAAALFVTCEIAKVDMFKLTIANIPFIMTMILVLLLVIYFPQINTVTSL